MEPLQGVLFKRPDEASAVEVKTTSGGSGGTSTPYDTSLAIFILRAVIEAYGPGDAWESNKKLIDKHQGLNDRKEPRILGALKAKPGYGHSPREVNLYNGNKRPNGWFKGFSREEVKAIFERAKELAST